MSLLLSGWVTLGKSLTLSELSFSDNKKGLERVVVRMKFSDETIEPNAYHRAVHRLELVFSKEVVFITVCSPAPSKVLQHPGLWQPGA